MTNSRPVLLVVDDEPGILRLIEKFARNIGFDVATAGSGDEALQKLQTEKAAVALVDPSYARRRRTGGAAPYPRSGPRS